MRRGAPPSTRDTTRRFSTLPPPSTKRQDECSCGDTDDQPLTSLRYRDNFGVARACGERREADAADRAGHCTPEANGAGSSEPRYKPNRLRRTARAIDGSRLSTCEARDAHVCFLKSRVFLVVLGLILLALFIWFAGPLFAFADWRPLESVTARLIAIGLVVLFWVGAQLVKRMRANRASDKLVAAVVQQSRAVATERRCHSCANASRKRSPSSSKSAVLVIAFTTCLEIA